jgi:hypothetical protein
MNPLKEKTSRRQELKEMLSSFRQKSAEERADIMIRAWFDLAEAKSCNNEDMPDGLKQSFFEWLENPHERQTREQALQRIVDRQEWIPEETENMGLTLSLLL